MIAKGDNALLNCCQYEIVTAELRSPGGPNIQVQPDHPPSTPPPWTSAVLSKALGHPAGIADCWGLILLYCQGLIIYCKMHPAGIAHCHGLIRHCEMAAKG